MSDETAPALPVETPKCPHCSGAISIRACVPKSSKFGMTLTFSSELVSLRTVGDTMVNADRLMKSIADGLGESVEVFLSSTTLTEKTFSFEALVTHAQSRKKRRRKAAT
jgi:hypothetical protein